jgi:hypothetical protein
MGMVNQGPAERNNIGQGSQVRRAADHFKFILVFELIGDGNEIVRLPVFKQVEHGGKNRFVRVTVKIIRRKCFNDFYQGLILKEYGAEYCLFRFKILGRNQFRVGLRCGNRLILHN